jgi:hypothetical protein
LIAPGPIIRRLGDWRNQLRPYILSDILE